jgi:hypothetical protein
MKTYDLDQVYQARNRYAEITNNEDSYTYVGWRSFWGWLGLDGVARTVPLELDEHLAHRIELLLSPHYKALYKAHQIVHGSKKLLTSMEVITPNFIYSTGTYLLPWKYLIFLLCILRGHYSHSGHRGVPFIISGNFLGHSPPSIHPSSHLRY